MSIYEFSFSAIVHSQTADITDLSKTKYLVIIELADIVVYTYTPRERLPYDPDYIEEIVEEAKKAFAIRLALSLATW